MTLERDRRFFVEILQFDRSLKTDVLMPTLEPLRAHYRQVTFDEYHAIEKANQGLLTLCDFVGLTGWEVETSHHDTDKAPLTRWVATNVKTIPYKWTHREILLCDRKDCSLCTDTPHCRADDCSICSRVRMAYQAHLLDLAGGDPNNIKIVGGTAIVCDGRGDIPQE